MALEMGLVAVAGAAWTARRKAQRQTAWPAAAFLTLLTAVQILSSALGGSSGSADPTATGAVILGVYLIIALVAVLVDRGGPQTT